ncbi:sugar transferase [Chryseobacterium caseinilyticum]|uniref:Sugar transferase n=1 Tax=Chryseobacterium caseinilyticum TaxID=2771428 RepID=A0ABR8ZHD0_9FLAO|nr:sugar transferase [Chryseobacterium caseinilyticum]MBD8084627.1 sugar transferase [Chryseobacterium caseinilyticum]
MIRTFDFIFSLFGLLFLCPIVIALYIVGIFYDGSPIFVQERMGRYKKPFKLLKFRTMPANTESVATHLSDNVKISKFGSFLRKSKLDELPQLINVLIGDMSLVGPRPNLYNQTEVIEERDKRGVYNAVPGITGLAQINEIDMSTPVKLAEKDAEMIANLTVSDYFRYIFATVGGKGQGDRIQK